MAALLKKSAQKALSRFGDKLAPRNGDFPSWTELGCIEFVDEALEYVPKDDLKDLNMLLGILAPMPNFVYSWLIRKMGGSHDKNGMLSSLFRQLDLAIKGLVLSTYYSGKQGKGYKGKTPLEVIDYQTTRMPLA